MINLARDGGISVNGKPIVPDQNGISSVQIISEQTLSNVVIRAHPDVPCSNLVEVINLCLTSELYNIELMLESDFVATSYPISIIDNDAQENIGPGEYTHGKQFICPDGSAAHAGVYLAVILYKGGIVCMGRKITEKELAEMLRILGSLDNEEERQILVSCTPDVIFKKIIQLLQCGREHGIKRVYFRGM